MIEKVKVHEADGKIKKTYRQWASMRRRHPGEVCARWSGPGGYANFMADMGDPPVGMTLGWKCVTKPYGPGNCEWQTWQQQADRREKSGPERDPNSLKGRARAAGLPYMVVYLRIHTLGWSEEKALTTPKQAHGGRAQSKFWAQLEKERKEKLAA